MTSYYETHITIEALPFDKSRIKRLVELIGWKFSAIEGDIVLGDGVKYYATMHFNARLPENDVVKMLTDAADYLTAKMVKVVRRKVEKVIYDDRSSKVKPCDGACVECHLDDLVTS